MRRLIAEHFKSDGRPKKPLTETQAKYLAGLEYKRAYRCKFCKAWHLGGHDRYARGG